MTNSNNDCFQYMELKAPFTVLCNFCIQISSPKSFIWNKKKKNCHQESPYCEKDKKRGKKSSEWRRCCLRVKVENSTQTPTQIHACNSIIQQACNSNLNGKSLTQKLHNTANCTKICYNTTNRIFCMNTATGKEI